MKKEIKIRQYYRSDEKQSIDLLLSKLPSRAAQAAFPARQKRWRWQYYDNPNYPDGEPVLWVATMDEKVVGIVCPLAVGLKTPRGIVMGSWCNDWIVSAETRGTGLGRKLEEKWQHTFPVALGRGWSDRAYEVSVTLGFATVAGFWTGWFVLSRPAFARRLHRLKEYRNLRRLLMLPPRLSLRRPKPEAGEISVSSGMPNGTGDLWARVSEAYAFAVDRREAHLRWRYEDHPAYRYEFVSLSESEGLKGLAVVRVSEGPQPVGVITELMVDPARPDLVASLFTAAVEHLRSRGACAVRADIVPKLAATAFATPYTCLKQDLKILVYSDIPDLPALGVNEARNWYLSCGDSDADF
jgi:GNAT superfamily N-acetyltransferase